MSAMAFPAVRDMLDAYRAGGRDADVFKDVLGLSLEEIDKQFADYLDRRFGKPLRALYGESSTEKGPYPTHMADARKAIKDGNPERAIALFSEAQLLLPEHAGPGSTYRHLADLYAERGAKLKAITQLSRNIDINADDLAAHQTTRHPSGSGGRTRRSSANTRARVVDTALCGGCAPAPRRVERTPQELGDQCGEPSCGNGAGTPDPLAARYALARALNPGGQPPRR